MQSIIVQLQDSDSQHDTFIAPMYDSTRNLWDPNTPPGFHCAHLGQRINSERPLIVQVDGSWDKVTNAGGVAWVTNLETDYASQT